MKRLVRQVITTDRTMMETIMHFEIQQLFGRIKSSIKDQIKTNYTVTQFATIVFEYSTFLHYLEEYKNPYIDEIITILLLDYADDLVKLNKLLEKENA